jgi:autotransporter-associated beta strand protein
VNVNAGVLAQGAAAAMPLGAVINAAPGGQFDFAGMGNDATRGYSFTIAGSGPDGNGALFNSGAAIYSYASVSNLTLTADAILGGNNRWDVGSVANSKIDGRGFNLTKVGAFAMGLRVQTITNLASITVSNGNMWYENFDQTNAWTATTTNYVKPGAFLGNYGTRTINLPIALDNATLRAEGANGVPTWTGPIKVTGTNLFNNATVQNLYGVISGSGTIGIDGGRSAQVITNANTYAGGTVVSNAPSTALAAGASGTAAVVAGNATALGTGPLTIDGSSFSSLLTNTAFFGTNILRPVEFNVRGSGVVLNAINLPGAGLITNVALQGRDANSIFTLAGKISGGFVGLTNWFDNGAGNFGVTRLSNPANDFMASRIFLNRGTLALAANGVLGNVANVLLPAANSTVRFDSAAINLAHPIMAANNPTYLDTFGDNNGDGIPETANTVTISGIISGGGTIFPRGTNGTLILTGVNTFSGGFELQQPMTLQVGASANLGNAYVAIKFGSTFRYTGTGAETMTRTLWMDNNNGGTIDVPSATAALTWNPGGGTFNQPLTKTGSGALTIGTIGIGGGFLTANGGAFTVNSVISGGATQVRVNTGTLTLNGGNTYGGPTVVDGGSLFVHGSLAAGNVVTVAPTALLGGNGTINGPVTVSGALQPGNNNIGKLTINSVVTLMGTTTMEINKAAGTNDAVVGATTMGYGGTLTVNNLAGTLAAGDTFKLFGAWAYMGSFTATNLPALSAGLAWDTSGLVVDGTIKVVSSSAPPALSKATLLPNGNLQLTLAGTVGQGYKILGSTNVSLPVVSWSVLQSGTLPTATYNWEDTDTKKNPTRFYLISTP